MGLLLIQAVWKSLATTARHLWCVSRQLFHEVTGSLFAVYSLVGLVAAWREWRHGLVFWLFAVTLLYSAMMAWFAFDAFRSARRIR